MSQAYMGKSHKDSYGKSQSPLVMPKGLMGIGEKPTMPNKFDFLKDYISFELTEDKLAGLDNHYNQWLKDDSEINDYSKFQMIGEDKVIVRLYRYEAIASTLVLDPATGGPLTGYKILPYCKVLTAHPSGRLKVGQIVCCNEDVCSIKTNPAWLEWNVGKENGDFKDVPQPDRLGGVLGRWKEFIIRKNPTEVTADDNFTFVLSDREFRSVLKVV